MTWYKNQWCYNGVASGSKALQWCGKWSVALQCRWKWVSVTMVWHVNQWLEWRNKWLSGVTMAWQIDQWRYGNVASGSETLQWRDKWISGVTMAWQVEQWGYNDVTSGSVALQLHIVISRHWLNGERPSATVTNCPFPSDNLRKYWDTWYSTHGNLKMHTKFQSINLNWRNQLWT
jgi:hypothetical protein